MAKRDNHYDVAFEAYLRSRRIPYVAVDESRRSPGGRWPHPAAPSASWTSAAVGKTPVAAEAPVAAATLKSVDFIVSPHGTSHSFLVDVKGRRFPSGKRKQYWRNWTTGDELESLARWETLFGGQFAGLLVFAYWVVDDVAPVPPERLFAHHERLYGFIGIRLDHYLTFGRIISPKWNTLSVPSATFRSLARPVEEWLDC
jgi:hypothetical protein